MRVLLKPGREKSVQNKHPWIFSGAVESLPACSNGEILSVHTASGDFLAKAYIHTTNSICARILTFHDEAVETAIEREFLCALKLRNRLFDPNITNCFRLINAEGDGLPGLIIDLYDQIAVLQVSTWGMEKLKPLILELCIKHLNLKGIYEKSSSHARVQEGLADSIGLLWGECPEEVLVKENHVLFLVNIARGQKTGFFLDQREMRQLIYRLASQRNVLNCFSYTGGFSLFALKGGAEHATSVDISQSASALNIKNRELNNIPSNRYEVICCDVFDYLKNHSSSDLVILDPPAFVKKRQDIDSGSKGYKEINRRVLESMPSDSYLLTSSCSHFVDQKLFGQLIFQAARDANRSVKVCSSHIQALDHPVSLFHPEGSYLKSLLLHIN